MTANERVKMRAEAESYGRKRGFALREELGWGIHGSVWKVSSQAASADWVVKIHRHRSPWEREAACYERLKELEVTAVGGLNVPLLLKADGDYLALELTLVKRPFLLDFGAAWLDERPDFPEGVWEQAKEDAAEKFDQDWPRAKAVLDELETMSGIIMGDIHPGNLALRDRK